MNTNSCGVTENAFAKIDQDKFREEIVRIFGEPEKKFCDECGFRPAFCECEKEKEK